MKTRKTDAALAFAEKFFNADWEARRLVHNLTVEFLMHSSIPADVAPSLRAFRKLRQDQRLDAAREWIREVCMGPPFARGAPMTRLDMKAIRARADALDQSLSGGEWRSEQIGDGWALQRLSRGEFRSDDEWCALWWLDHRNQTPVTSRGVGEFIAAARTDVPALCDRVEALEAALRDALEAADSANQTTRHFDILSSARAVLEGREP